MFYSLTVFCHNSPDAGLTDDMSKMTNAGVVQHKSAYYGQINVGSLCGKSWKPFADFGLLGCYFAVVPL